MADSQVEAEVTASNYSLIQNILGGVMIVKNEFPILEYDTDKNAIIMPSHEGYNVKLPKKAVLAFLGDEIEKYAEANNGVKVMTFLSITKLFPLFVVNYKGEEIAILQAPVGASASVQLLDWLAAYGVEEVISAGSCGALVPMEENVFLVPKKALRDEGASYHYLPPSRFVDVGERARRAIEKTLEEHNLKYIEVITWTTDGFYRETRDMVEYRVSEGCTVVEMECSALAACAEMRGITWGQILYTGDTLADAEEYDPRNFGNDSMEYALRLCMDTLLNL